ncbi:hypothetical protein C0Q70_21370 [Pomacea canaliculata]|uniref:Uncharacterized protein n=1 Tax=Pomacea canaliculata TaxID=400727 RepID=A0A2T7NCD7_POMCA|nr:hypothetical protein C0Q70_21370 [Pomacea canaliculata]
MDTVGDWPLQSGPLGATVDCRPRVNPLSPGLPISSLCQLVGESTPRRPRDQPRHRGHARIQTLVPVFDLSAWLDAHWLPQGMAPASENDSPKLGNPIVDGCNHLWSEVRKEESWLPEELALTEGPIRRRRPLPGQRSQGP